MKKAFWNEKNFGKAIDKTALKQYNIKADSFRHAPIAQLDRATAF